MGLVGALTGIIPRIAAASSRLATRLADGVAHAAISRVAVSSITVARIASHSRGAPAVFATRFTNAIAHRTAG